MTRIELGYESWMLKGKCAKVSLRVVDALFFYTSKNTHEVSRKREQAKAFCSGCPVTDLCKEDALNKEEVYHTVRGRRLPSELQDEFALRGGKLIGKAAERQRKLQAKQEKG